MKTAFILPAALISLSLVLCGTAQGAAAELGIKDTQFTLNGKPTFLLGISYYGALGASEDFIRRDLDDAQRHGFNWIRVFATWSFFGNDVSAVDEEGKAREPFLGRLKWLIAECDRRGMAVDVTLMRDKGTTGTGRLPTLAAHRRAVETLVAALKPHRNWYLDLANERNIPEFFTSLADVKTLRDVAKKLDPQRLITASHSGDISGEDLRAYLQSVQVDFISPHRPRHAQSPAQTAAKSREYLAWMKETGRSVPLHYQEPLRSGWAKWQPKAVDFITDLNGARAGGAAGWCFHNGDQGGRPDGKPRRSFDLREQRLFEQFDEEETKVLARLAAPATRTTFHAADVYFGLSSKASKPTGYFRLGKAGGRDHLVTPEGNAYLALGINHIDMLQQKVESGLQVRGDADWQRYWTQTLKPQFDDWHLTTFGYGVPAELKKKAPWFAAIPLARIEKHRSDPKRDARDGYHFPDVFDPAWATEITAVIHKAAAPLRDDPFIIGCFWTDTPTWDLHKTRALRGMNWVDALRALPASAPGRRAYAAFLEQRYADRLIDLNSLYGLTFTSLDQVRDAELNAIAVGRHVVQEDDEAFLALIAQRFYEVVGKAQREADANHLIFGDRYLAGDAPESVLKAAAPWIDAVAVQPGDRYSPLYPASTHFPEAEIESLHRITGKPVLICDHAISFPTDEQPLTIFEQMPNEITAAKATTDFLAATFAKPYIIGYLRCQYIDRPAGFGRGLRQGILKADGTPREAFVEVYRERFAAALKSLQIIIAP